VHLLRQSGGPSSRHRKTVPRVSLHPTPCVLCENLAFSSACCSNFIGLSPVGNCVQFTSSVGLIVALLIFSDGFHHTIEIEAAGLLARWKVLEALQSLADIRADRRNHEHLLEIPPLEAHRVFFLSTLERIHSQIGNDGCSQWRIGGARSFDNSREWFLQNP
jgi:hypothetical protein